MRPDPERVARLSAEILQRLEKLSVYTRSELADFQADERTVLAAKMLLVEAVEGAAALCNHIMARVFREAPGGFILCFEALATRLGWEEPFRQRLRRVARFRSELIHEYREITPEQVYRVAREEAHVLAEMVRRLREWLQTQEGL
ncbi:DUF86 domain-containing protein [Thermoflexus sp.]|uniref:DUF86 domain-containing protein n=1 Tax=Thermoflexus sp. TaxID=1969742 RepID=UPI0035E45DD5